MTTEITENGSPLTNAKLDEEGLKVLQENPHFSPPEVCARVCKDDEPSKICYFRFVVEIYTSMGPACNISTPNSTSWGDCQCVQGDGIEKGILTVNRMVPGPSIQCCEGDKVVIDVHNQMDGLDITFHWHGILQKGTQYYDGVPMVTQCAILQGDTFRYQWFASCGTNFWHSHTGVTKIDGLYGSIIVRQPPSREPNCDEYKYDLTVHVILISDWMHKNSLEKFPGRMRVDVGMASDNMLINGKGRYTNPKFGNTTEVPLEVFKVTWGYKYRFRLINSCSNVCPAQLSIQGHTLLVIATDGGSVKPVPVNSIVSSSGKAGERYDFVINAVEKIDTYWIQVRALGLCAKRSTQQLAILQYDGAPDCPSKSPPKYDQQFEGVVLNPADGKCSFPRPDAICVNQLKNAREVNKVLLQEIPDVRIFLPYSLYYYDPEELHKPQSYRPYAVNGDHLGCATVDGISYVSPPSPLLSQINDIPPGTLCCGDQKPGDTGMPLFCTHVITIPFHALVEMVFVDEANLSHPLHLHGYQFTVIGMGRSPDKNVSKISLAHCLDLDRDGLLERHFENPPSKDTVTIPNNGYAILRFRADNPGYWLLHCHFLFHLVVGMALVVQVGKQSDMPPVPENFPRCGNFLPQVKEEYYREGQGNLNHEGLVPYLRPR